MKTVLITGATSGIGFELALYYAKQGYKVIASGRREDALKSLCNQSPHIYPLIFDITDLAKVKSAAQVLSEMLTKHQWQLHHVVLNAGSCEYIDNVMAFDAALFARVINTNLIAMGNCLEAFIPLIEHGGQLGLMSSSATYLPFPRAEAYGASKAGVSYLAKSLRIDLANQSNKTIGVSEICPGFVKTPLTDKNDFSMPMRISAVEAAKAIFDGMKNKQQEIHFPKRFTYLLKLLACLPLSWQSRLLQNA